jgi:hypothetical protein
MLSLHGSPRFSFLYSSDFSILLLATCFLLLLSLFVLMASTYIIRIELLDVTPAVWREIQVPINMKLNRFHQVIQAVMGWEQESGYIWSSPFGDYADLKYFRPPMLPKNQNKITVQGLFGADWDQFNTGARYLHNLQARWMHDMRILKEGSGPAVPQIKKGSGACPPDALNGVRCYAEFKKALKKKSHKYWKDEPGYMRQFSDFDPTQFLLETARTRLTTVVQQWNGSSQKPKKVKSRALVLIDGEPVRKAYRQQLNGLREELKEIENELERYNGEDSQAFKQWLHATFGVQLSRIQESQEQVWKLLNRLSMAQQLMVFGNMTSKAAYQRALRIESGEEEMPDFSPPPSSPHDENGYDDTEPFEGETDIDEIFRDMMRDMARDMGIDEDGIEEGLDSVMNERSTAHREVQKECQALYRQIARSLHPDRGQAMSEAEARLWYRAQDAYAAHDALTLKQIWTQINDPEHQLLSCSDILQAMKAVELQIQSLILLRNSFTETPHWNFSRLTPKKQAARARRVEKDLKKQEQEILEQLEDLKFDCELMNIEDDPEPMIEVKAPKANKPKKKNKQPRPSKSKVVDEAQTHFSFD